MVVCEHELLSVTNILRFTDKRDSRFLKTQVQFYFTTKHYMQKMAVFNKHHWYKNKILIKSANAVAYI